MTEQLKQFKLDLIEASFGPDSIKEDPSKGEENRKYNQCANQIINYLISQPRNTWRSAKVIENVGIFIKRAVESKGSQAYLDYLAMQKEIENVKKTKAWRWK